MGKSSWGQWRTDGRGCTAGQSSAKLHPTPGSSIHEDIVEVVPALHWNVFWWDGLWVATWNICHREGFGGWELGIRGTYAHCWQASHNSGVNLSCSELLCSGLCCTDGHCLFLYDFYPPSKLQLDSELTFWTCQLDRKRQWQECLQGTGASLTFHVLLLDRALDLLQTWISRKDEFRCIFCHTGPLWCLVSILCNTSQGITLYNLILDQTRFYC